MILTRSDLFRVLGDPTRLRLLALLAEEPLTVSEIQEVIGVGQSTVSGHLAQLRRAGLVSAHRDGAHVRYVPAVPEGEADLARLASETPIGEADRHALESLRQRRAAPTPDELGPEWLPGRSWEALAHLLLGLLPPLRVAELGVGTGRLTTLLARSCSRLIAVDVDPAALEALQELSQTSEIGTIETRVGRIEDPPLQPGEVELILLSQSLHCVEDPLAALRAIYAVLPPGGRVAVLDLAPHEHAWVRARFGHVHLGFPDLGGLLSAAGFSRVSCAVVHRDRKGPVFTTLLALGVRPESS